MKVEIEVPDFTVEYLLEAKQDSGVVDGEWAKGNLDKIKYLQDAGCIRRSLSGGVSSW